MKILGLIPARGGSKGVPRKNVALLAGRPLLAYTCDAARGSHLLDHVIVSTDDDEIAAVARREGVGVPFMRPREFAGDDTPMIAVVRHAMQELDGAGSHFDAVAVLQPTSPLRRPAHIDRAIELLQTSGAETVVSVIRVPHQFSPSSLMRLDGDRLVPNETGPAPLRRQDKPLLYARNGPAVLLVTRAAIESGGFYNLTVAGFEMGPAESLDVDTSDDLAEAEWRLTRRAAEDTC